MTNNEARKLFIDLGLTYQDAFLNLEELKKELSKTLKEYSFEKKCLNMTLRRSIKGNKKNQAFFRVDGPYFKDRECISFNPDGFIGFAGWADSSNSEPILIAFANWCKSISGTKGVE